MALSMGLVSVGSILLVVLLGLASFVVYLRFLIPTRQLPNLKPPLDVWYQGPEHDKNDQNDITDESEIDIIAVHGLGENVDWTWTWRSKNGFECVNWLSDPNMLPHVVPKSRIMVYTYNTAWLSRGSKSALQRCGEDMIRRTHDFQNRKNDRPIIFIGHSFGGIVIEYGLIYARRHQELQYLAETTVGCVFLATPFRGSRVVRFYLNTVVGNLGYDEEELADTMHEFISLAQSTSIPVICFYELYRTSFGTKFGLSRFLKGLVVPQESAILPGLRRLGLSADHVNMNKFGSPYDSSFLSVSAEILKMYENRNVVLRQGKRERDTYRPQFMVPFGRNEHFVGREAILAQLLNRIPPDANNDTCQRTVLEGLGGIGKTQIALEVIYRLRDQDPACSFFWVRTGDATSFEKDYYNIGRLLQIPEAEYVRGDIKPLIREALSQEARAGKWLLVIDNADDPDLFFRGPSLAQFLPFSRYGSILFTTRNHQAAVELGAMVIKVTSMQSQEALKLLSLGVEPGLVEKENAASTVKLLGLLTHLPLAISHASAYLNENQISSTQYLELLHLNESKEDTLIGLLGHGVDAHGRYRWDEMAVTNTFIVSFDQLRQSNKLATEYLQLISFLNGEGIPYAVLPTVEGKAKMIEAVGRLKAFAFIRQRHEDLFDSHRLVQLSVRQWVRNNGDWDRTLAMAVNRLDNVLPIPEYQNRDKWAKYLPHVLSVLNLARQGVKEDDPNIPHHLMSKTGTWLNEMGNYGEAEAMFQAVLVMRKHNLGDEHPDTLLSMSNIGAILFQQGRFEKAMNMLTEVVATRKRIFGDHHPDVLSSMNNLACTLKSTGRLDKAMKLHTEVLHTRLNIFGDEHPQTLLTRNNIAAILFEEGRLEETMSVLTEVLKTRRRIFSADHPDILSSMSNLACTLESTGRIEEAISLQEEVLYKTRRDLGSEHPSALTAMSNLAIMLKSTGRIGEAVSLQEQVLYKTRRDLGSEHPSTLEAMSNLTIMLESTGRIEEAIPLLEAVLNQRQQTLGIGHPSTLSAMSNLAKLHFRQGRIEEAVTMSTDALEKTRQNFGGDSAEVVSAMHSHSLILRARDRVEEAEEIQKDASNRMSWILGQKHLDSALLQFDISLPSVEYSKFEQEVEVKAEKMSIYIDR